MTVHQSALAQRPDDSRRPARNRWVPGEVGIWSFILTDMSVFGIYFVVFASYWAQEPEVFSAGHHALSLNAGVLNTILMLTASLFVALAMLQVRQGRVPATQRLLAASGLCGLGFMVNKYFEWSAKVDAGHTPRSDHFFQMYFVFTGVHLLHVLIAMVLLALMIRTTRRVNVIPNRTQTRVLENCASYWHLVDLLWLGLFALLYLMN